jgi:hypothetical protein
MPLVSSIVTRWPVLVSLPVAAEDRDADGRLTVACVERFFADARRVYVGACRTLDGRELTVSDVAVALGPAAVEVGEASVSVSVVEVFDDRFTMHARVRPAEGDGIAAEARADVLPGGVVTRELRDELIAHAHGARHYH